jgi:hypothetical protein
MKPIHQLLARDPLSIQISPDERAIQIVVGR